VAEGSTLYVKKKRRLQIKTVAYHVHGDLLFAGDEGEDTAEGREVRLLKNRVLEGDGKFCVPKPGNLPKET